jgi:hypothetical protein
MKARLPGWSSKRGIASAVLPVIFGVLVAYAWTTANAHVDAGRPESRAAIARARAAGPPAQDQTGARREPALTSSPRPRASAGSHPVTVTVTTPVARGRAHRHARRHTPHRHHGILPERPAGTPVPSPVPPSDRPAAVPSGSPSAPSVTWHGISGTIEPAGEPAGEPVGGTAGDTAGVPGAPEVRPTTRLHIGS